MEHIIAQIIQEYRFSYVWKYIKLHIIIMWIYCVSTIIEQPILFHTYRGIMCHNISSKTIIKNYIDILIIYFKMSLQTPYNTLTSIE